MRGNIQVVRQFAAEEPGQVVAAAASATGASHDTSVDGGNTTAYSHGAWSKFRASIYADQVGTLVIQQSRDNVTWRTTVSQAAAASSDTIIESLIVRRYARAVWTNNAGAPTTVCELDTALLSI